MHYVTKFLTTTPDGKKYASSSIGAAYAELFRSLPPNATIQNVLYQNGDDGVVHLIFNHLEDLVVDLYRMGNVLFHMHSFRTVFSDDGELMEFDSKERDFTLKELQSYLISNYHRLQLPIHLELNTTTGTFLYSGQIDSQKKFEIFEKRC